MKFVNKEYYQVTGRNCSYFLADKYETLEDAIEGGKEMNKKEVSLGYKPSEWIVTRTTWCRCFDNDGSFVTENSSTVKMSIDGYL